jgi:hypothetical protein
MRYNHPVYGEAVYSNLAAHNGRWLVRGGAYFSEIENAIRDGLTNEQIRIEIYGRQVDVADLQVIREKCGIPSGDGTLDIR